MTTATNTLPEQIKTAVEPYLRPCRHRGPDGRPVRVRVFALHFPGEQFLALPALRGVTADGVITGYGARGALRVTRYEDLAVDDQVKVRDIVLSMPYGG